MSNPNGTQAVDRAATLLSEVVHASDPVTFTELTARTGLAKSTTSRLLLALERNHLVRRDDGGLTLIDWEMAMRPAHWVLAVALAVTLASYLWTRFSGRVIAIASMMWPSRVAPQHPNARKSTARASAGAVQVQSGS